MAEHILKILRCSQPKIFKVCLAIFSTLFMKWLTNDSSDQIQIIIEMLKISRPSICKPLQIFLKSYLESGVLPLEWKKENVVPVHKKILLFLACRKIVERLLYNYILIGLT